jgi:hypothetical protein
MKTEAPDRRPVVQHPQAIPEGPEEKRKVFSRVDQVGTGLNVGFGHRPRRELSFALPSPETQDRLFLP